MTARQALKWIACLSSVLCCILGIGFLFVLKRYALLDTPTLVLTSLIFAGNLLASALMNHLIKRDW